MMGALATAILAVSMIGAFILAAGGARLILARRERRKGALMLVAALVILANVAIWAAFRSVLPAATQRIGQLGSRRKSR